MRLRRRIFYFYLFLFKSEIDPFSLFRFYLFRFYLLLFVDVGVGKSARVVVTAVLNEIEFVSYQIRLNT